MLSSIENNIESDFNESYKKMSEAVTKKMEELLLLDKNLGLYSLAESKNKTAVQYPDAL